MQPVFHVVWLMLHFKRLNGEQVRESIQALKSLKKLWMNFKQMCLASKRTVRKLRAFCPPWPVRVVLFICHLRPGRMPRRFTGRKSQTRLLITTSQIRRLQGVMHK